MIPLLLASVALAAEGPRVQLDAVATYSIGGQTALGGEALTTVGWKVWETPRAQGDVDVGLWLGVQAEPWSLAPWIDPEQARGMSGRVRLLPNVGHTIRFGELRRFSFGVHLYGGAVAWWSQGQVTYPEAGVDGEASDLAVVGDWGGLLRFTAQPHPVVGVSLVAGAPIFGATSSSYVVGLFTVGAGLTFRVR